MAIPVPPADKNGRAPLGERVRNALAVFRQVPPTFRVLWAADARGTVLLALVTLFGAALPVGIAWTGKLIVDAVVHAAKTGVAADRRQVLVWVGVELALLVLQTAETRLTRLLNQLIGAKLGFDLNVKILDKALELELQHFEDSDVYDKMQNARREASSRPLSLVTEAFTIGQSLITLVAYAALLVRISPWSVVILVAASIPAFIAETKLSAESFRLNSWRAPEGRKLNYLEWILTRDNHVKEVKLFDLGPLFLGRYKSLYGKFYAEDRALAVKRMVWGLGLGLLSVAAFYGCYGVIAWRAAAGLISLGDMTLYIAVFRQGQDAFRAILFSVGSMYEDALFMSNLFLYLGIPTKRESARVQPPRVAPRGPQRIELRHVSFRYPGKEARGPGGAGAPPEGGPPGARTGDQGPDWALKDVNLVLEPGEKVALVGENGAGKSTLVKLLMRLYEPTQGEILYGGVDVRDMDVKDLRARIGAVHQDFVRYQLPVSENIGLGDVARLEDRPRVERAASDGGAAEVIETLPQRYDTVLGGWFEKGQELSSGQWQKLAVARAFMRDADVLILDEPTASIDAEAEHALFERFRRLAADRTAIVISHRFSTVRIADRIAVLKGGAIEEMGSHEELLAKNGRYAHLFRLQAKGYE